MRIGIITTLQTNIGDDLIRVGIQNLLRHRFGDGIDYVLLNKHRPFDAFGLSGLETVIRRLPRGSNRLRNAVSPLLARVRGSIFDDCDLIIQSGAPVLWPDCQKSEWAVPIWKEIIGRLHQRIPVLNLAAGACYPWEEQPRCIKPGPERNFASLMFKSSRLTVCRDDLAQALWAEMGHPSEALPCAAFLAARAFNRAGVDASRKLVLANYMQGGGHFSWGQAIDPATWEQAFRYTVTQLAKLGEVVFLAHDQRELDVHRRMFPEARHYLPRSTNDYFDLASNVRLGVFNRLHAAVGWAGHGVPSVAIGTDTRLKMVEKIGLPALYVRDCDAESLEATAVDLWRRAEQESERLTALSDAAFAAHSALIAGHV